MASAPSATLRMRAMFERTVAAAGVTSTYEPPADVLRHAEQFQMPVETRVTVFLPQKTQSYLACCDTSILRISCVGARAGGGGMEGAAVSALLRPRVEKDVR